MAMVRRKEALNPDDLSVIDAALYWANKGVAVFPCLDKRPLTKHGFQDAVKDPEEVRKLFEFYGEAANMVGAAMGDVSGLWAIDLDLYKGKEVDDWMKGLIEKDMLPESRVHKTPRGGIHIFYNGSMMPKSSYPLDGVEVRGNGSYVIVPGGSAGYSIVSENIVSAPKNLLAFLGGVKKAQSQDTVSALKDKILASENFHDSIARLAARYAAMGWSQEKITASIVDTLGGSMASSPQHPRHERWKALMENQQNEFMRAITTAHKKYNTDVASQEFTEQVDKDVFSKMQAVAGVVFKSSPHHGEEEKVYGDDEWPFALEGYSADVEHDVFDAKYVVYPVLVEDESVLIAANPKAGKTAIILTLGLHLAIGRDLGASLRVEKPRGVLYFGLEGRRAIRLRIQAWKRNRRELGEDVPANIPLHVVERSKNLLQEDARKQLVLDVIQHEKQLLRHHGVSLGLITFDTLTKAMPGGDQNSVEDTSLLFDVVSRLRDAGCRATVVFLHHKARAGNVRGSTNIEADVDVVSSVSKEGDRHIWSIDNARSIEEGLSFHYKFTSYSFGIGPQGYPEKSFVVTPVDNDVPAGMAEAMKENKAAALVVSMGKGTHALNKIIQVLAAQDCAPMTPVSKRIKSKPASWSSQIAQDFFTSLIPEKGWAFAGVTLERVMQGGKIMAVHVY